MRRQVGIFVLMMAVVGILSDSNIASGDLFYPISGINLVQSSQFYAVTNLIEGPNVGFDPAIPHNRWGLTWVTDGFGADYFTAPVGPTPIITIDLGEDRALTEIDVWGYASSNANGASQFSLRFATSAEGTSGFGTSIAYNPTFYPTINDVPRQQFAFSETVTAQYVEFTALDNFAGMGLAPGGDRVGLGEIAFPAPPAAPPTGTGIINPTLIAHTDLNTFSTYSPGHLTDNSGLSSPVDDGDSLAHALSVTQIIDTNANVNSWVTNANTSDYFSTSPNSPTFVWDLRADVDLEQILLWQYPGSGGGDPDGAGSRSGNCTRTVELRFNTEAEGSTTFTGLATTVTMSPIIDTDPGAPIVIDLGDDLPEGFALDSAARYVEMRLLDNHYGDPDGFGLNPTIGGDRVGLGEVRFYGTVVPEPGSLALLALGAVVCGLLFRRGRLA